MPNMGFVKVNWNAVVNKNKGKMVIGVIMVGEVLVALIAPRQHIIYPTVAEGLLFLLGNWGCKRWN